MGTHTHTHTHTHMRWRLYMHCPQHRLGEPLAAVWTHMNMRLCHMRLCRLCLDAYESETRLPSYEYEARLPPLDTQGQARP